MRRRRWNRDHPNHWIREKSRKGMFILPSIFTVANIFCGFNSVSSAIKGNFELAGLLIGFAMILDTLDGRIARLTHTTSQFGLHLDSLADVITFGLAPAVLCYQWAFYNYESHSIDRAGWLACFLFLICAASRLARFNVQTSAKPDKRYFTGMPTPASAGFVAATIYCFPERPDGNGVAIVALAVMSLLAFLMVSKVRYRSFKDLDLRQPRSFRTIAIIGLIFVGMAWNLKTALITIATVYLLSGMIGFVLTKRQRPVEAPAVQESASIPLNPS